jgi:hypothetical protein
MNSLSNGGELVWKIGVANDGMGSWEAVP